MDSIIIELKKLAIELAGTGAKYVIDELAGLVIPKQGPKKLNANEKITAEHRVFAEDEEGNKKEFIVSVNVTPYETMLNKDDQNSNKIVANTSISRISNLKPSNHKELATEPMKIENNDFKVEFTWNLANSTEEIDGSFSVLNGILGITW